jgi:hypothetical protein
MMTVDIVHTNISKLSDHRNLVVPNISRLEDLSVIED